MTAPDWIRTVRWMLWDTTRQSVASRLVWVMLAVIALATVFCLGVDVTGDAPVTRHPDELPLIAPKTGPEAERAKAEGIATAGARLSLGFGLFELEIGRGREDAVRFLQLWLAGAMADTAGVLFALLWTAGFLPTFLDPQAATVLLAKPAPRWAVLLGKYAGVVLFVGVQAAVFVGLTWAALGVKTGVWPASYWLAVPLLVLGFAVFYAVSALLAVCTRSTVVCVFGTLLFWLLCWGVNFTRHRMVGEEPTGATAATGTLLGAGYWVLPKPLDLAGVFFDAMEADRVRMAFPELEAARAKGEYRPELSVLTSVLFAAAVLGLAAYEFRELDY